MREVQCSECLELVPLGYAVHSHLTVYDPNSGQVQFSQKMYACCASHHNDLLAYYKEKKNCQFYYVPTN